MQDTRVTERYRKVPEARLSRLAALGQMAGGVAAGALGEGMRQLARGERPRMTDLLLTPGNARRVTDQLSRMRGAAMKLGQMISLDAGDVLPAELTAILARLREQAHVMPPRQLDQVLARGVGPRLAPAVCTVRRASGRGGLDRAGAPRHAEIRARTGDQGAVSGCRGQRRGRFWSPDFSGHLC